MNLFLTSHLITPNIRKDFEELVKKSSSKCSVSFVTTAANPMEDKSWMHRDIDFAKNLFKEVEIFDIEDMSLEEMSSEFKSRDILYVNGGSTSYLMKRIRETGLEKVIEDILKDVVYVGSSAGSMIWSRSLEIAEWYPDGQEAGASKVPGIGLLDFQIYPHFEEESLDIIKSNKKKEEEYWLLKNNQAVSYRNGLIGYHGGEILILPKE